MSAEERVCECEGYPGYSRNQDNGRYYCDVCGGGDPMAPDVIARKQEMRKVKRDVWGVGIRSAAFGLLVATGLWFDDLPLFLCAVLGAIVMALAMIVHVLGDISRLLHLTKSVSEDALDDHVRNYHYKDPTNGR